MVKPRWVVYCVFREEGSYVVDGNSKRHHHQPRWAKICINAPEIMQRANYDYSGCSYPEQSNDSSPNGNYLPGQFKQKGSHGGTKKKRSNKYLLY